MRRFHPAVSILLVSSFAVLNSSAQTATTATLGPQAAAVIQSATAALSGATAINDITLTGTAEWIAGSDDETGTVTYQALVSANRLALSLSGGPRSEIRSTAGPTGSWSGSDAISHTIALHNLVNDPGWFPLFVLENLNASTRTVLTYVGPETRNGQSVIHVSASQQAASAAGVDATAMQHLSQIDLYLDASTLLPTSYVFNVHPDDNELVDIPVEIKYSNYQSKGGTQIPLHVQKFVNNTLSLDLQFQSVSLNTGLTAAQISAH